MGWNPCRYGALPALLCLLDGALLLLTRDRGGWIVDAEDPDASELGPSAGEGTGDIEGLEGEDVADEGFELPFDDIASSTGVP